MTRSLAQPALRRPRSASLRSALLAGCASALMTAPALAQEDPGGPVARGTPPEGGTIVYTTWREGRGIWNEYYWVVPEGYGDAHGVCLSQTYSTFMSETPQAYGSVRNQPLSFCNRDDFGNYTPGRAPWDRASRGSAEEEQGSTRFILDDTYRGSNDFDPACLLPWNWFSCPGDSSARRLAGSAGPTFSEPDWRSRFSAPAGGPEHIIAGPDTTIDGIRDTQNRFSNVVLITVEKPSGTEVCTGTLINRRQVLAAAHCFEGDVTDVRVSFDPEGETGYFGAMSVTVHENYDPATFNADVAVITLNTASLVADPVTLEGSDGANTSVGSTVILAGYGNTGTGTTGQIGIDGHRRHGVNVLDGIGNWTEFYTHVGAPVPGDRTGSTQDFIFIDFDGPGGVNVVGDGAVPGEVSSAQGDSGGPMFVETANGLIQIGIVSNGGNPYGPLGGYGTWVAYIPVAGHVDWIDGLDPFIERHALAGDGYWHDAAHWELGDIPENDRGTPGETVVTDQYLVPEIYEVYLDQAGRTTVVEDEYADAVYVFDGAELVIAEGGQLVLDTGVGLAGGNILVEGELIGQALELQSGVFTVAEGGSYYDFSPYYSGGMNLSGASVVVAGVLQTDWLHQTAGLMRIAQSGVFYDYEGSLIEDGSLIVEGVFDTVSFNQFGGSTSVYEVGLLYDASGETYIFDSQLYVGGEIDTLELVMADTNLAGDGTIRAPFGVYQFGGSIAPGFSFEDRGAGGSLTVEGDYYLTEGAILVTADAGGTDHLRVTGAAQIDGLVDLQFRNGYRPSRNSRFTYLVAEGGVLGADVETPDRLSPVLSFAAGRTETSAYLEIVARDYADFAQTDQQRALATALDAAAGDDVPTGEFAALIDTLDYMPSEAALQTALQTANPTATYGMDRLGFDLSRSLGASVAARMHGFARGDHGGIETAGLNARPVQLASADPDGATVLSALQTATSAARRHGADGINDRTAIYVSATTGWGETDLPNGSLDIENQHFVAGLDHEIGDGWLIGANAALSVYDARRPGTRVDGEAAALTVYAGFAAERLYASGYAGLASSEYELSRTVSLGAAEGTAIADTDGRLWHAGFDIGADFAAGGAVFGPVLHLRHSSADIGNYTETGLGAFNAGIDARRTDQTLLGAGGRFETQGDLPVGHARLTGQLTWEQDISTGDNAARAALAGAPEAGFAVLDGNHDDGFASLSLGIVVDATDRLELSARLRSDFARDTDEENAFSLAIGWRF